MWLIILFKVVDFDVPTNSSITEVTGISDNTKIFVVAKFLHRGFIDVAQDRTGEGDYW